MTAITSSRFDLDRFARATEERDASTQVSMYAPDATVTVADRITQPGSPRVLQGRAEIAAWIEEVTARDMTHAVQTTVKDDRAAALTVACRYPDGTNVLCATVLELRNHTISNQTVVQVWDESN
ncbi:MAG TPA: nuclear transport factor 2 family protein [Solirubrobacteraceae bacterium]|jgi:ketosteroid isomerase-like protein